MITQTKQPTQVSWFQAHAAISLGLIQRTRIQPSKSIIDIGDGTSMLVDDLLASGYQAITVLDISTQALSLAQGRLGARANTVTWLEADITDVTLTPQAYAVWHDRAVFHFLTQPADRGSYIECELQAVGDGAESLRAPILKAYLKRASWTQLYIPVSTDAPISEFEKIAAENPVINVTLTLFPVIILG